MTTQIGMGFSQKIDTNESATEAAMLSRRNLKADAVDIVLIFCTIHYEAQEAVSAIRSVFEHAKLIGCSTAGIILPDSIKTRGISVLAISSADIHFGIGSVEDLDSRDTAKAGNLLAKETLSDFGGHSRQAFMFFVDGNLRNNSALLKGIQEVLGNVFPILGAGSCDNFNFSDTFQIFQDSVHTNSAAGLIIGGHASVGVGCQHGWRPLGKPRIIDEVEGNVIKKIGGKEAASLYEEYFGEEVENLRSTRFGQMSILYPLGIFVEGSSEYLLRNTVHIEQDGSIVCQGDVPQGAEVHIMIGNKDSCKQAAFRAAQEAKKGLLNKVPKLILIFESMARLKLLGRMAYEEIESIAEVFGTNVPLIGMYTNGEVSPFQTVEKFKKPYLLNESIIVLAIS